MQVYRRGRVAAALGTGLALMATALTWSSPGATAAPAAADASCPAVQVVWARGSGQSLGEKQYRRFRDELAERLTGSVTPSFYEVGTAARDGNQYPAVAVDGWDAENALGGLVSAGNAFDYGNSVWEGVLETQDFVHDTWLRCGEATKFVLGGFSQGAQVIGQTYGYLTDGAKDQVVFNALFGDPKLNLPEGKGWNPPACRGENLSPWRRAIGDCDADNGSLFARDPYLPAGYTTRTGLWCAEDDFVCGTSKFVWNNSGHDYSQDGGDVDSAAIEIARRLREAIPETPEADLDTTVHVIGTGTTGLDVVFVIDSTGSMGGIINDAKQFAAGMASQVRALRGRVALVEYRDAGDAFVARTLSGLTEDLPQFQAQLDTIVAGGGGDTPEATLAALMQGLNSLEWRPGATKAAVVLTDAGFHDPDVATGDTTASVAARALEIDPVNVYPVVPASLESAYTDLADQTSGQVIVNDGDAEVALTEALDTIQNRPVALLALTGYRANPGQTVRFDASDSYATEGSVASYAWDFDGDGTFDRTTPEPVTEYVYTDEFDGQMAVKVTDTGGGIASMSAPVLIADVLPGPDPSLPAAPENLTAVPGEPTGDTRQVALAWQVGSASAPAHWAISVNGVPAGVVAGDRVTATVTDMAVDQDAVIRVAGLTAEGAIGEAAEVSVPGKKAEEPTPTTPPNPTPPPTAPTPAPTTAIPGGGDLTLADVTSGKRPRMEISNLPAGTRAQLRVATARFDQKFRPWRTPAALNNLGEGSLRGPILKRGWTGCFSVRSVAGASASPWSEAVCTARRVPDRKWSTIGATRDGRVTVTAGKNAKVTLRGVRDGQVVVFFEQCRECGTVQVMVQGKRLGTVKSVTKSAKPRRAIAVLPYREFERGTLTLASKSQRPVRLWGVAVVRKPS